MHVIKSRRITEQIMSDCWLNSDFLYDESQNYIIIMSVVNLNLYF